MQNTRKIANPGDFGVNLTQGKYVLNRENYKNFIEDQYKTWTETSIDKKAQYCGLPQTNTISDKCL